MSNLEKSSTTELAFSHMPSRLFSLVLNNFAAPLLLHQLDFNMWISEIGLSRPIEISSCFQQISANLSGLFKLISEVTYATYLMTTEQECTTCVTSILGVCLENSVCYHNHIFLEDVKEKTGRCRRSLNLTTYTRLLKLPGDAN